MARYATLLLIHYVKCHAEPHPGVLRWGTDLSGRPNIRAPNTNHNRVALEATPRAIRSGGDATVAWKPVRDGSFSPTPSDWIGLYCGVSLDHVGDIEFLEFKYMKVYPLWQSGKGLLRFAVTIDSLRQPRCEFRMFNNDDGTSYLKIGVSNVIDVKTLTHARVSMHATPAAVQSGNDLTLTWNPSAGETYTPKSSDWIGYYCGTNASFLSDRMYSDWNYVTVGRDWQTGSSSTTVRINSLRQPTCEFRMFNHDDGTSYNNIGISNVVSVKAAFEHLHLALTGESTEMRVQWTAVSSDGFVEYVALGATWNSADLRKIPGVCHTYVANDMCLPPANDKQSFLDPGMLCEATLIGLIPDALYKYQVSSANREIVSDVATFRAAPEVNPEYSFSFLVYGDMGTSTAGALTASHCTQAIQQGGARMIHHFGDLSYARGVGYIWDVWMSMIEPYAKLAPYMIGVGNHDFDYIGTATNPNDPSGDVHFNPSWFNADEMHSNGECGVPTAKRFHMPAERSAGNGVYWHSYDFGSLHTIMLSTEHYCEPGSKQYAWLERDLAKVDRSRTPWVIIEMHRPMYNNQRYQSDYTVAQGLQREFEELLVRHDVDLVLAGHYHSYLRSKRIFLDRADDQFGIYHFTVGSAGFPLDGVGLYEKDWVAFFDDAYGFGRITIANSSAMHWEFIGNTDDNNRGAVLDEVWILKKTKKTPLEIIWE